MAHRTLTALARWLTPTGTERWEREESFGGSSTITTDTVIASGPDDQQVVVTIGQLRQLLMVAGYVRVEVDGVPVRR